MSALMLAFELFGGEGLSLHALCIGVAYMLSGYYGLYSEQKIVYSKFRAEWIDKKASECIRACWPLSRRNLRDKILSFQFQCSWTWTGAWPFTNRR